MLKRKSHKKLYFFILLIFMGISSYTTLKIERYIENNKFFKEKFLNEKLTNEQLYDRAVRDAMTIEEEEKLPVVKITKDSEDVTWNEDETKVLLISWHRYPNSYRDGATVNLNWGEIWTFTDKEIKKWFENNSKSEDWDLRFKQLIGLPLESNYTHFTAFWVNPNDIIRPAYNTDITSGESKEKFSKDETKEFEEWFEENILWSYFDSKYPWTRLGYTYDWADNGVEYGLSEFIIKKDAEVTVEFTKTTKEFVKWLKK